MSDMNDVLNALISGTINAKVKWFRSSDANEFATTAGSLSAVIRRVAAPTILGEDRFLLEVVDDEGSTVEALESREEMAHVVAERRATNDHARRLSELFLLARRSARDIPNTLQQFVNEINSD